MRRVDLWVIVLTILLTAVGMLAVYSAGGTRYLVRQLVFLPVAVAGLLAAWFVPRRVMHGTSIWFYGAIVLLLGLVLFLGAGPGSRRWFVLGPVAFQPSEFTKLAVILLLARHLAGRRSLELSFRSLAVPVLICLAPAVLIVVEPDLSAALTLGAILAAMLYWQGLRPLHLLLLFIPLLSFAAGFSLWTWIPFFVFLAVIMLVRTNLFKAVITLAFSSFFALLSPLSLRLLRDYQADRIRSFLAPWFDPHGVGWNAIQSRIAIGSGQLFGKGFLCGTQNRLGFLPNRHTDFVFSGLGEEFGFIGALFLLGLLAFLIRRLLVIARHERDNFSSLLCVGCAAVIGYQAFINIGMLLGIMPITGVALPFISYGGSSLLLSYVLVGLVLNVSSRPA
ncbi:MAG: rod shape-determining protein RodA [candidate division WOR-3 bacterium]|nr:MAG: rod shape-determining protein RodA [candidate division WOR-3 bacterium]